VSALASPRIYVPLLVLALLLIAPRWMTPFYVNMAILFLLFAVWGHAWNIIGGYANSLSLGHSAFVTMGAYAPVLLMRHYEITPIIGVWAGVVLSMGLAVIVGWATVPNSWA
jgi:branched-chain amino acid transport system permease protein